MLGKRQMWCWDSACMDHGGQLPRPHPPHCGLENWGPLVQGGVSGKASQSPLYLLCLTLLH